MYRVWLRWVALPEFARDECLSCQSQPSLFRAKESPLKKEISQQENNSEMCRGNSGPLKEKVLPVGWTLAQWSHELEKKDNLLGLFAFTSPKDLDVHSALLLGPLARIRSGFCQSVSQPGGDKRQNYSHGHPLRGGKGGYLDQKVQKCWTDSF